MDTNYGCMEYSNNTNVLQYIIPNNLNTVKVVLDRIGPLCVVLVLTVDPCRGKRFEVVLQCTTASNLNISIFSA